MTNDIVRAVIVVLLAAAPLRAEVIDRILATVGGGLILQSDAVAAVRLGFIDVPPGQRDPLQWALDRLVERRLMLLEVERSGPADPTLAEIDARLRELDARIGSGERLDEILREAGISAGQLRVYVRDQLRLENYVRQRFGPLADPREEDIVRYYREHPAEFTVDGVLRPFAEVRDRAREAVRAQREAAALREWLVGLRRRTEVNVLYLPAR